MATGIFIAGFGSILTGLNFIITVHKMRAPGLTWFRLPLFIWSLYATSLILVLATPVLGGQLAVGMTGLFGRSAASIDGTLTTGFGPFATTRTGSIGDSITSVGDLYPMATLKWNAGVHNFMSYMTGDIPVGAYDPNRLANIGIGHGAIDGGGGYTYLNPQTGEEFSAVAGFTYNFKNQDTQYQNGIDFHVDWGASKFLSKQVFVGLVGYLYQQVTDDFGQNPILGGFRSRVVGLGPRILRVLADLDAQVPAAQHGLASVDDEVE